MNPPSLFNPEVEHKFAAFKARHLRPPIDDWLRRNMPKNSIRLSQYFPTLEKMFDRGESAYNNEDWRHSYQDSMKVAEFIFKLKKHHHAWSNKQHYKNTTRMIRQIVPRCLHYAEQCQKEIKNEISMELEAIKTRSQNEQEMERERARQVAEAAERKEAMLREEAKRAKEQGEEARAALAAAQAEEAAADSAAAYAVVVGDDDIDNSNSGGNSNNVVVASVVDYGESANVVSADVVDDSVVIDEGVPMAPFQSPFQSPSELQEGQNVTYCKKSISLPATIVKIHRDDPRSYYYTIRLPGNVEKQTTREYIRLNVPVETNTTTTTITPTPLIDINPAVDFSELGGKKSNTKKSGGPTSSQPPPPSYQPRHQPPPPPPPPRQQPKGQLYGQIITPSSSSASSHHPKQTHRSAVGGWKVNSKCDIQDRYTSRYTKRLVTEWRRGQILAINGSKILVSFFNWSQDYNIWINYSIEPNRLAPYGSKTAEVEKQWQGRALTFREQLERKGLKVVTMRGDGNCLFRAVAHQIWGDPELHAMVRAMTCDFMLANRGEFAEVLGALVPGPNGFERYVSQMRRPCFQGNGEWGGDPEIRVMEELFDRPFELWDVERGTSNGPANIHLEGSLPQNHRVDPIRVSYHGKNHYNSVQNTRGKFPLGELNTSVIRSFRKKDTKTRNFDTGYK